MPTSANNGTLVVECRLICIDASEWDQPFLSCKLMHRELFEVRGFKARVETAYYADSGRRLFADVRVGLPGQDFDSAHPSRVVEASLHTLCIAAGVAYLMPQYFFGTQDDLQQLIIINGFSARATTKQKLQQPGGDDDDDDAAARRARDVRENLVARWKSMCDNQVVQQSVEKLRTFMQEKMRGTVGGGAEEAPPPMTMTPSDYINALGKTWFQNGFNLHVVELAPAELEAAFDLGPRDAILNKLTKSKEDEKTYRWWAFSGTDVTTLRGVNRHDLHLANLHHPTRPPLHYYWGRPHLASALKNTNLGQ